MSQLTHDQASTKELIWTCTSGGACGLIFDDTRRTLPAFDILGILRDEGCFRTKMQVLHAYQPADVVVLTKATPINYLPARYGGNLGRLLVINWRRVGTMPSWLPVGRATRVLQWLIQWAYCHEGELTASVQSDRVCNSTS